MYNATILFSSKVSKLAVDYVRNLSLFNDMSGGGKENNNMKQNEAYVWGSNSSCQFGEQLHDKVMLCKKSKVFVKACQVCSFCFDICSVLNWHSHIALQLYVAY